MVTRFEGSNPQAAVETLSQQPRCQRLGLLEAGESKMTGWQIHHGNEDVFPLGDVDVPNVMSVFRGSMFY